MNVPLAMKKPPNRAGSNRPMVPRRSERLESLGPMRPGRCNYCGQPLPKGHRADTLTCSEACARDWNSMATTLGRQMFVAAVYTAHGQRSRGIRFNGISAMSRLIGLGREAHEMLRSVWKIYDDL